MLSLIQRLKYALAFYKRGNKKYQLGRYEEAIAEYDQAIFLNPDNATYFNKRAKAKYHLDLDEEAFDDYDKAILLDPSYATCFYHRGVAKAGLGLYQEAIADFDQVICLKPTDAKAFNARGNAKYSLGNLEEALADYKKAIELDPKNKRAVSSYNYALALERMQNKQLAPSQSSNEKTITYAKQLATVGIFASSDKSSKKKRNLFVAKPSLVNEHAFSARVK